MPSQSKLIAERKHSCHHTHIYAVKSHDIFQRRELRARLSVAGVSTSPLAALNQEQHSYTSKVSMTARLPMVYTLVGHRRVTTYYVTRYALSPVNRNAALKDPATEAIDVLTRSHPGGMHLALLCRRPLECILTKKTPASMTVELNMKKGVKFDSIPEIFHSRQLNEA